MNPAVEQMLARYSPRGARDYENALKEILQELALLALARANFFEKAAFYGGTALRILYGLPRFSEDLDFTLFRPDPKYALTSYFAAIRRELAAFGFDVEIEPVQKSGERAARSAFLKANTRMHLLQIEEARRFAEETQRNKKLQVKFEVDTDPATRFKTETRYVLQPVGFPVITLQKPDLFAAKIHALLCRAWKQRVKGRDYYDFAWHVSRSGSVRREYLEERLRQSAYPNVGASLDVSRLRNLIRSKVRSVSIDRIKEDVRPFLRDPGETDVWSYDYFAALTDRLTLV